MKFLLRLIGTVVVIVVLVTALLFYLDDKGLLFGKLGELVHTLRALGTQAWGAISSFSSDTGVKDDAAGLWNKGVSLFEKWVKPIPTSKPGVLDGTPTLSPDPALWTSTPLHAPTASPTPEFTFTPTPAPTYTPVIAVFDIVP